MLPSSVCFRPPSCLTSLQTAGLGGSPYCECECSTSMRPRHIRPRTMQLEEGVRKWPEKVRHSHVETTLLLGSWDEKHQTPGRVPRVRSSGTPV